METVIDVISIVNLVAALAILAVILWRGNRDYLDYTLREKVFQNGFVLFAFGSAFASGETLFFEDGGVLYPFIFLVSNAYAVRAFASYHKDMFKSPTEMIHDNKDE
jgi:hypothetical protein